MRIRSRITRITKLRRQLATVRQGLCAIADRKDYVPDPAEMQAMKEIQWILDDIAGHAKTLEPQLWQRVDTWRNTPWTLKQKLFRNVIAFLGWWLAGTMTLAYSVLGWFSSLFPQPWHIFPVSAVLAFVMVAVVGWRERTKS